MEDTINILCATDNNYVPCCGIMLTSLCESNKNCRFELLVLADSTASKNKGIGQMNLEGKAVAGIKEILFLRHYEETIARKMFYLSGIRFVSIKSVM